METTIDSELIEKGKLFDWDYFTKEITNVFKLSEKENECFYKSNTAKIIAAIPFVARCNEPERTSIAHLCIYEAEIKGFQKYYAHLPSDDADVFKRLAFISTFQGGDQAIIEHGMNMLAYIMVEGYNHSKEKDIKEGIYNPIANGKWNYQELHKRLLDKIQEIDCPDLDKYFTENEKAWMI